MSSTGEGLGRSSLEKLVGGIWLHSQHFQLPFAAGKKRFGGRCAFDSMSPRLCSSFDLVPGRQGAVRHGGERGRIGEFVSIIRKHCLDICSMI